MARWSPLKVTHYLVWLAGKTWLFYIQYRYHTDPEKFGDFCTVAPINMPPQIDYFANFVAEGMLWAYVSRPLKTLGGPEYT